MAMMVGQIVIAQHHSAHVSSSFSEDCHVEHDAHHDEKDGPRHSKNECPECLLSQTLNIALYNTTTTLFLNIEPHSLAGYEQSSIVVGSYYNPNAPRAPPIALI